MQNTQKKRLTRLRKINIVLKKLFPEVSIALSYNTNWELLVAVILSAQCTDVQVNKVTKKLFKKYGNLNAYVNANPNEFEKDIHSTGFYRNKTKNILAAAKKIKKEYDGEIPNTMEDILTIPGVARKTANVVLGNVYGVIGGIAVDTHVKRFAQKFDLTNSTNPKTIERDLMDLLPKKEWFLITYRLIEYGRQICSARKHDCKNHPLTKIYPPAEYNWPRAK